MVKNLPAMRETQVQSLGREDPLEKGMMTYSNIFAWRIPWTEEPGGPQSVGLQRVRYDWDTTEQIILLLLLRLHSPISRPSPLSGFVGGKWWLKSPNLSHHWFPLATSTPNTPTPTPVLQRLSKIHLTSINSDWEEVVRNNKDTPFTFDVELFQELERNRIYQKMLLWLLSLGKLLRF